MNHRPIRSVLLATLLAIAAGPAVAQIEEIIVTAEKRAESVQDVGLAVTAFDERAMDNGGIDDVSRIELLVPGVNFAYAGNDAKFNVRGANSTNTFADNGSIVGTFVDGVYKPRASQQSRAFFDVQRIEFLKGPQGTLYGRNTFAGALNLYTNAPDLESFGGNVKVSYASFNTTRFEGVLNLPASDNFGVRLAAFAENGDGHIKNSAGPNLGAPDDRGFRLSALWEPTDTLSAILRVTSIRESGTTAGLFGYTNICRRATPQGLTDPFGSERDCQNPQNGSDALPRGDQLGPWEVSHDFVPDSDVNDDNITLELNFAAGPLDIKSITSYSEFENLIGFDFDYSQNPFNRGWFDERADSFTQELQFNSDFDGPIQWTGGLYYSQDETFFSFSIFNQTQEDNNRQDIVGPGGETFTLLSGTPLLSRDTFLNGPFADSALVDTDAFGAYSQVEFSISDRLRLIGGLRYNDESKDLSGGGSNFSAGEPPVVPLFNTGDAPLIIPDHPDQVFAYDLGASGANNFGRSFDNFTWKAGFEYDLPNTEAMLYLMASTGFLSGSVNGNGSSTDEQESEVYELGLKSIWMDGSLLLNVAAHRTDYTNLLSQFQVPIGGIVQTFSQNGGEIESTGLEIESVWYPTDDFSISFLASFLDTEFGTFGQVNPYQLLNGQPQGFVDVAGETPGWAPEFTSTVTASYVFDYGTSGTLTPYLQFFTSDDYNTSNFLSTDPNHQQDSFSKTDFRLTWRSQDDRYVVEAFVENIEDEAVLARGNNGGDDNIQTGYLYPRNVGIKFELLF